MIRILKRTGHFVDFNADKISSAIIKAMKETKDGVDEELAKEISIKIQEDLKKKSFPVEVEIVQDMVENQLMDSKRKDVAKKYILYRYERDKSRDSRKRKDYKLLSEEFISH
ncbi:MAG: ATP cone domain-containing protein, partial [Sedimentibacter sp.]